MKPWFLYIVQCTDNSLYTGIALDVEKRVAKHNSGTGAKYVQGKLPVVLAYSEKLENQTAAMKREIQIKKWSKARKLALIQSGR